MISEALTKAARDYRWLLNRDYPEQGSIALVGDRYRLDRGERHMLYRGISSHAAAEFRLTRIIESRDAGKLICTGAVLGIDGHNVLLTVANYLQGISIFECDDGLLRDIGGVHGRVHDGPLMRRAIELTAETVGTIVECQGTAAENGTPTPRRVPQDGPLSPTLPASVEAYLDAPVSHSGTHANLLRDALTRRGVSCTVQTTPSADAVLRRNAPGVLATSDSALVDVTAAPVYDIARAVLASRFSPNFDSFRTLLMDV